MSGRASGGSVVTPGNPLKGEDVILGYVLRQERARSPTLGGYGAGVD